MTSRERILTTLQGGHADRVPIWAWSIHPWLGPVHPSVQPVVDAYLDRADIIHWWGADAGIFLTASDRVRVHAEERDSGHPDFAEHVTVFHTPAGELREHNLVSREGKPGYRRKYLLESEEDVARLLSVPCVPPHPDCSGFAAPAAVSNAEPACPSQYIRTPPAGTGSWPRPGCSTATVIPSIWR